MLLVGLTGGIGVGKSLVTARLREKGAVVIDADEIAREVVAPGSKVLERLVERFGEKILDSKGHLDRKKLAEEAFGDQEALKDLNAITHPAIGAEIAKRIEEQRDTDRLVIVDAALLVESGREGFDKLVVVAARPQTQLERLVTYRRMDPQEAERRIASQAPLEDKIAKADIVIWNEGTIEELMRRVDEVWEQLSSEAKTYTRRDTRRED